MSRRDLLARAMAGYDKAFEARLVDELTEAIARASMIDNVMVLRTGETAAALVTALASMTALSPPATRSRTAIRKTSEAFRKKLAANVLAAEHSPDFYEFKRLAFHDDDRDRGGNG